jgi:hypothetical protein
MNSYLASDDKKIKEICEWEKLNYGKESVDEDFQIPVFKHSQFCWPLNIYVNYHSYSGLVGVVEHCGRIEGIFCYKKKKDLGKIVVEKVVSKDKKSLDQIVSRFISNAENVNFNKVEFHINEDQDFEISYFKNGFRSFYDKVLQKIIFTKEI